MITLPLRPTRSAVRAHPGMLLALALVLTLSLLSLNLLLRPRPTPLAPVTIRPPYRTLADLPLPLQFATSRDLGRDDPSYYVTADQANAHARNPAQGLAATFDNDGLHISTGDQTWALALVGWGRGDTLTAIPPAAPPVVRANRLEVAHGSMDAWYVNGPLGIQQGWTLAAPPPGAAGRLTLAFAQSGSLRGTIAADGGGLTLNDAAGTTWLRYGSLLAFDATGRELAARLEEQGTWLRVSVDTSGATYPITIDPWVQKGDMTTTDRPAGDAWASAVAVSGDGSTVILGESSYSSGGAGYLYVRPQNGWANATQTARLTTTNGASADNLGHTVAVNADGNIIILGSSNAGGYVYIRPQNGWKDMTQSAKLTASDAVNGSYETATISDDGSTIVLGMPYVAGSSARGAGYVYVRPPSGWTNAIQTAKLTASDATDNDYLGMAAAISASGSTIVLDAPYQAAGGIARGAGYVYVRPPGGWANATQTAKLTTSAAADYDNLGIVAAMSSDGSTIVLGAPYKAGGFGRGAGYIYVRPPIGWANATQTAKLTASDSADYDQLGRAAAISADGSTILLGAPGQAGGGGLRGAGYIYVRLPSGWANATETTKLIANNGVDGDGLGAPAAMSRDGNTIILSGGSLPTPVPPNHAASVFEQLSIISGAPPAGVVGVRYSFSFTTNITAPLTWSVSAGVLQPGLSLDAASGVLSGTPMLAGSSTFTVHVGNGSASATQIVMLTVNQAPAITSGAPLQALVGSPYSFSFSASGSPAPTWQASAAALPAGLTLNPTTGELKGTPTTAGVYTFTIQASNGIGNPAAQQVVLIVKTRIYMPLVMR